MKDSLFSRVTVLRKGDKLFEGGNNLGGNNLRGNNLGQNNSGAKSQLPNTPDSQQQLANPETTKTTIFNRLFGELGVPSEFQANLSIELALYLGSNITDPDIIEKKSKEFIIEFLKSIAQINATQRRSSNTMQAIDESPLKSSFFSQNQDKKSQLVILYQASKDNIVKSYGLLIQAKKELHSLAESLTNLIKNDQELLEIYTRNKIINEQNNPAFASNNLDDISSIGAQIANDLKQDLLDNPQKFSHLNLDPNQLYRIANSSAQDIRDEIQKGIDDKKESHLRDIKKAVEEDLIKMFYSNQEQQISQEILALQRVLETGKIKLEKNNDLLSAKNNSNFDLNKDQTLDDNNRLINEVRIANQKRQVTIDVRITAFDFETSSHLRTLGIIANIANDFLRREKSLEGSFENEGVKSNPKLHTEREMSRRLKPNPRFTEIR